MCWSIGKAPRPLFSSLHYSKTSLLHGNARHRDRAHPFPAADGSEPFVRCRLDANRVCFYAERGGDVFLHRRDVRRNFRRFRQQSCVNIHDTRVLLRRDGRDVSQNFDAADSANRLVRVRKMFSDVAGAECAEDGVGDGVGKNVSIGMSFKSAMVRNLDAAKNKFPSAYQTMRVVTDAAAKRTHNFKSMMPFDAMML